MAEQRTMSGIANAELAKDIMAKPVFGHDMMSIRCSEAKGSHLRFAIDFKDNNWYEGRGGEPRYRLDEHPGFVLAISANGFTVASAYLMRQREVGSMEGTVNAMFNGVRLATGKCDAVFRDILTEEQPSNQQKPEKLFLLEKLARAADAMSGMYNDDLQALNGCYLPSVKETISLLEKISYAAHLAMEKVKEEQGVLALRKA